MINSHRCDAWNLLYVTSVNVCYWKSCIELYEKRCRWTQFCAPGLAVIGAIVVAILDRSWVVTVIPPFVGLLIVVLSEFAKRWITREAKTGHERWSELCSDAEALWRSGEQRGWGDSDITARTAVLAEREKQYQANDYHKPKTLLLNECQTLVRSQLTATFRQEEL